MSLAPPPSIRDSVLKNDHHYIKTRGLIIFTTKQKFYTWSNLEVSVHCEFCSSPCSEATDPPPAMCLARLFPPCESRLDPPPE